MATRRPQGGAMTLFEHFVAEVTIRHMAAVTHARGLGKRAMHTPGEAELTRLNVALIEKLHTLAVLYHEYGGDEVFGPRDQPLTAEQILPAKL